jgi:hypothetical protein
MGESVIHHAIEEEPDIVEMEGDKNVRPKWINAVFRHSI